MSSIEKIAMIIGNKTKENLNLDSDQVEIIVYGAINILQTINSIFWVIAFGFLTGTLFESLMFSISAGVLRKYSGGGHASSPMRCAAIGTITAVIGGLMIQKIFIYMNLKISIIMVVIITIININIIIKKAPVDSIEKPIRSEELRKKFRIKSIILLCISLFIIIALLLIVDENYYEKFVLKVIQCLILGELWQCITLTDLGIFMINKMDKILKYIFVVVKVK